MTHLLADAYRQITNTLHTYSSDPLLIAVSKKQPLEKIIALYRAGCRDFGENYMQEWQEKAAALREVCSEIRWHFIGHLQGNKLPHIVGNVQLIHSLASLGHLEKIHALATARGLVQEVLVQVNLAEEASKDGITAAALAGFLQSATAFPAARIVGLMTFPPPTEERDRERLRPYFTQLRQLRDSANKAGWYTLGPLRELSMGTSDDWKIAVAEGATMLRLGTTLFGARE